MNLSPQANKSYALSVLDSMIEKNGDKPTQKQKILMHLIHSGPITPIEALNFCGSFRLGARINELRNIENQDRYRNL